MRELAGPVVGEVHEADEGLDLEVVEVGARGFSQPPDLLVGARRANCIDGGVDFTDARLDALPKGASLSHQQWAGTDVV